MTLWFYIFIKINSPSTLNRNGRISKSELYHTSQQLSQYDCPIRYFLTSNKYIQGIKIMQANLKKLYSYALPNFNSKCETWFFLILQA